MNHPAIDSEMAPTAMTHLLAGVALVARCGSSKIYCATKIHAKEPKVKTASYFSALQCILMTVILGVVRSHRVRNKQAPIQADVFIDELIALLPLLTHHLCCSPSCHLVSGS